MGYTNYSFKLINRKQSGYLGERHVSNGRDIIYKVVICLQFLGLWIIVPDRVLRKDTFHKTRDAFQAQHRGFAQWAHFLAYRVGVFVSCNSMHGSC